MNKRQERIRTDNLVQALLYPVELHAENPLSKIACLSKLQYNTDVLWLKYYLNKGIPFTLFLFS